MGRWTYQPLITMQGCGKTKRGRHGFAPARFPSSGCRRRQRRPEVVDCRPAANLYVVKWQSEA